MKAVMYGAGNIGRGFIGALFSQSGYDVIFVDIAEDTVSRLHEKGEYTLSIVSDNGSEDVLIKNVDAVHGSDTDSVADAIAYCDIMATAVGANTLRHIASNIASGLRQRFKLTDAPINIIICENLMDADKLLERLIKEQLSESDKVLFDERVGLVEASIGRMVPVQTEEMRAGDPLKVCVERYGFLPVDKNAFKGEIPKIEKLVPYSPFGFFIRRKLYVHNMAHAVCAYLGLYVGEKYIFQSIDRADIQLITKNAMLESIRALSAEYNIQAVDLLKHADDLLLRFTNSALGDTCARVGSDTVRKLAPSDRLIGAASFCLKHGITPVYIAIGAAAAIYQNLQETEKAQTQNNANSIIRNLTGLSGDDELSRLILDYYSMLSHGATPKGLRNAAEKFLCKSTGVVV